MSDIRNGVSARAIDARWVKSKRSTANGQCVELASLPDGRVAMRDSKDAPGPALVFAAGAMYAFLDSAKSGEFQAR